MKMTKATEDDIKRVNLFFLMLEEVIEEETYTPPNDDGDGVTEPVDDERLAQLVRQFWGRTGPGVGPSWRRVVRGADMLIRNCCDPDARTLEWRPDLRSFLESAEAAKEKP
ncbi:MAG: hypothetical protein HQ581_09505 [Planctomycetes bacterium]|nr:hypothetical protein [Planctomycetota bacterium]